MRSAPTPKHHQGLTADTSREQSSRLSSIKCHPLQAQCGGDGSYSEATGRERRKTPEVCPRRVNSLEQQPGHDEAPSCSAPAHHCCAEGFKRDKEGGQEPQPQSGAVWIDGVPDWNSYTVQGCHHSLVFFFFCQYIFYKDGQIANRS